MVLNDEEADLGENVNQEAQSLASITSRVLFILRSSAG
jgi:hypothetical protein